MGGSVVFVPVTRLTHVKREARVVPGAGNAIARPRPWPYRDAVYRKILVPLDGSPTSQRGLKEAIRLAKDNRARLRLVHVLDETPALGMMEEGVDLEPFLRELAKHGRTILERAERLAGKAGVAADAVMAETAGGGVADAILRAAKKWRADVIVMGTHGRRGLRHIVLGSEAEHVLRLSPVPVLLVRGRDAG